MFAQVVLIIGDCLAAVMIGLDAVAIRIIYCYDCKKAVAYSFVEGVC